MPSLAPLTDIGQRAGVGLSSAWSYVKGQCTAFVASAATWIPPGLGNANQWLHNAQLKGFATTTMPTVGSVVVYNAGGHYDPANGHVALVTAVAKDLKSFTVSEQNNPEGAGVRTGRVSSLDGVAGFILPPGLAPGSTTGVSSANPVSGLVPDIPSALGAIGKTLTQALYMIVGLILFGFGMVLLLKAEGVKTPTLPAVTPAAAAVKAITPKSPPAAVPAQEGIV